ncbi:MAG: PAS domain S-box protein [Deltaproteobacteria bacterium]|nr:PAS domain S-box protein [Deltaproteobacteria bacterium]
MNFSVRDRLTDESYEKVITELGEQRKRLDRGIKEIKMMEIESVRKDGSICWIEIKAKFISEPDGRLKIVGVSRDIDMRKRAEQQKNMLVKELEEALEEKERLFKEVKVLRSLLPICSGCKRIRDEQGRWWPLDAYVKQCTDAKLSHTICPDCREVFYGKR